MLQELLVFQTCFMQNFAELFDDFAKTKAFIDELIKTSQANKAPSEKQISFAETLAQKNNVDLPQDYKTNLKACSEFIAKYAGKGKK